MSTKLPDNTLSDGVFKFYHDLDSALKQSMLNAASCDPKKQQTAIDMAMIQFIQLNPMKLLGGLIAHPDPEIWEKYKGLVERLSQPPTDSKEFKKSNEQLTKTVVAKIAKTQKILSACKKYNLSLSAYMDFMREHPEAMKSGQGGQGKLTSLLMQAIKTKNIQMIYLLHVHELSEQANTINEESPPGSGITPMIVAVAKGDITMVKLLGELGAHMNPPNTVNSLIGVAINIPDIQAKREMVQYLYAQGAEIDQPDKNGMTPIAMAAIRGDLNTMQLLHLTDSNNLINLNRLITIKTGFEHTQLPLLTVLILNNQITEVELLKAWGVDQKSALGIVASKRVAQVWGIGGDSIAVRGENEIPFSLEGLNPKYAIKMLSECMSDFFSLNHKIKKEDQTIIQESIKNTFPFSLISDEGTLFKFKSGEPIVILGGCENHAVSIVIKDGQLGICNRGIGRMADGIEFYSIPQSYSDKEIIEMIRKLKTFHPNIDVFNDVIRNLNLDRSPIIIPKKAQEVGNCTWASSKGIFDMLYLLLHYMDMTVSKDFTTQARERELREYLRNPYHLDARILREIRDKINEKSEKPKSSFLLD